MTNTIRWRISLPFALLIVITMLGLAVYYTQLTRKIFEDNLKSSLLADARVIADTAAPLMAPPEDTQEINALAKRYARLLGARVTIIRSDGTVVGESDADQSVMDNHLSRPEVKQAVDGQEATHVRFSATVRMNFLYAAVPIRVNGTTLGASRVAVSLARLEAIPNQLRRDITTVTLVALLVTLVLTLGINEYTIRPLERLTTAAQNLAAGRYTPPLKPTTRDEIGKLNAAFNQMAIELRSQLEALQAERAKLGAVLGQMTDGVVIVDPEGTVQLINPAAERIFQVSEGTAGGRTLVEVSRHHQLVELWRRCLESGEPQTATLEMGVGKMFLHGIAAPLQQSLPGSTLLLIQDLTRMRRLETIRQDFISNISHELRTPLASLKALTETLQEGALEDPPAAHRFLARMDTEIDTLSQMIQELLELSRIESGKVPLQRKSLQPVQLLSPAVERMKLQAERAGLTVQLECPPQLPAVNADPDRLEQVLVNLLHNAIKFTPPGGKITVSAEPGEQAVIFRVHDTGVGIPASDLTRIFERFYKADRARSGGGTGLGLSIARHIIEGHGGRVWAESEIGQGSTFFFTLPTAG
jgi:two-component system phosphate regulon sensor histidine kinase PhoR